MNGRKYSRKLPNIRKDEEAKLTQPALTQSSLIFIETGIAENRPDSYRKSRQKQLTFLTMKKTNSYLAGLAFLALITFGCTNAATDDAAVATEEVAVMAEPDMTAIKAEIQEMENVWAQAQNEKNVEGLVAMYADDAVSMGDDQPAITGKDALRKDIEEGMSKRPEGQITSYETTGVFGSENQVTETGVSSTKDASGNVIETGKYMAVWEKRDGKYLCIRDIYNQDAPKK